MRPLKKVKIFTDIYPMFGPLIWVLSVQYFIIQIIAGGTFKYSYSLSANTISDLGNTMCGVYSGRYICSPQHNLMNASFILLGITMTTGALLIYQEFRETPWSLLGFSMMAIAGIGTIIVGLFPENTISVLHELGAALPFLIGNIGIIILGMALQVPRWLKSISIVFGVLALLSLVLFISQNYLGIGEGGIERLVAYPQTIWLIIFGAYISMNRYKVAKK